MIKDSVQQEDITILNLYTPNKRAAKCTKITAVDRNQSGKEAITVRIFAELDLSGPTVHVPLTMPILYLLLTLSLAGAVIIGNVSGSYVHVGHCTVLLAML